MCAEEQVQGGTVGHPCIRVAVVNVEAECYVWQELGILIDFMNGKRQGQDVLVELGHRAANKMPSCFMGELKNV